MFLFSMCLLAILRKAGHSDESEFNQYYISCELTYGSSNQSEIFLYMDKLEARCIINAHKNSDPGTEFEFSMVIRNVHNMKNP